VHAARYNARTSDTVAAIPRGSFERGSPRRSPLDAGRGDDSGIEIFECVNYVNSDVARRGFPRATSLRDSRSDSSSAKRDTRLLIRHLARDTRARL